jgi:hypothetical protein
MIFLLRSHHKHLVADFKETGVFKNRRALLFSLATPRKSCYRVKIPGLSAHLRGR